MTKTQTQLVKPNNKLKKSKLKRTPLQERCDGKADAHKKASKGTSCMASKIKRGKIVLVKGEIIKPYLRYRKEGSGIDYESLIPNEELREIIIAGESEWLKNSLNISRYKKKGNKKILKYWKVVFVKNLGNFEGLLRNEDLIMKLIPGTLLDISYLKDDKGKYSGLYTFGDMYALKRNQSAFSAFKDGISLKKN